MPDNETIALDELGNEIENPRDDFAQIDEPVSPASDATPAATDDSEPEEGTPTVAAEAAPAEQAPAPLWYDSIQDETLRENQNITKYKSLDELARGHIELARKLGERGSLPTLPDNPSEEQKLAYNALRRGDKIKSPDDYSYDKGSTAPDVVHLKQAAFDAGLDDYQATQFFQRWDKAYEGYDEAIKAERSEYYKQEDTKLRMSWQQNYQVNAKAIDLFLQRRFPEAARVLQEKGIRGIAAVEEMLLACNRHMVGDEQITWGEAKKESVNDELKRLQNSEAYKNEFHKDHNKALLQQAKLYQRMTQAERERRLSQKQRVAV